MRKACKIWRWPCRDTLLQGTLHPSLTPLRRVCIYWLCVAACPEHRGNQSAPIGEGQAGWALPDVVRLWCHGVRRAPTGASFSYLAYINLASNREAFQIKVFRLFMSWLKNFTKISIFFLAFFFLEIYFLLYFNCWFRFSPFFFFFSLCFVFLWVGWRCLVITPSLRRATP